MIAKLSTLTILFVAAFSAVVGQNKPDSIVITRSTFVGGFGGDSDSLYKVERYAIVRRENTYLLNGKEVSGSKINILIDVVTKTKFSARSLADYGIDTAWVKNNPDQLLRLYSDKKRLSWNNQQKKFIYGQLFKIENYDRAFESYLRSGCCYTMHQSYRDEFQIAIYQNGKLTNRAVSRRRVWGYLMPWTTDLGQQINDYQIERQIAAILSIKGMPKEPMKGAKLLKYLVNKIIDNNMQSLYKLSAYSFQNEINELAIDFKIISSEEVYGRGRYIWDEPKTIKIVLQNPLMHDNVYLNFLASEHGHSIYTRDSILRNYKNIVLRIQSIDFIGKYMKDHQASRLDIYFFNDKAINQYNIESINKTPDTWSRYDKYVESLNWYEKQNIKPSFDLEEAKKVARQNDCGCNYRFAKAYIEKAIFFEIYDEDRNSSIWFLLPDGKILLYLMQGDKVLNYSYSDFGTTSHLQYPCVLFNNSGERIGAN